MVLVGLMVYTWGIFIHMLMKDEDDFNKELKEKYDYEFTNMMDCIWTLLMAGTLMLDNAAPLMHVLLFNKDVVKILVGVAVLSYCFLSALLILQMLIGVLCDVVSIVGQERRDAECVGLVRQELLHDLKSMDGGDGKISKDELVRLMEGKRSKTLLKKLNINRPFVLTLATLMFPDEDTQVPVRTILELLIMCRGDNNATVQIISSALCFLSNELTELHNSMDEHMESLRGKDDAAGAATWREHATQGRKPLRSAMAHQKSGFLDSGSESFPKPE
jgi:hypothetical protein